MKFSVVLLTLFSLCYAHEDVRYSSTDACESDHTCEYVYSLELNQFTVHEDEPMIITATVQITCESSGSYGSVDATRYCMTVTDFGGNYLSFGRNETDEAESDRSPMQRFAVNFLSGWFCFVQTSEGQIVEVFHSRTEDNRAVNFKKGIASAFQANFKGTAEETEIDPGSKHLSHYSYDNSEDGSIKMHRSISNNDVIEYPMDIPDKDVELTEEEDIEYRDGRLVRSNGTMNISMERTLSSHNELTPDDSEDNNFSNMFNARGSFLMELKVCRLVPLTARGRRNAVREHFDSDSTLEESLMATFDKAKMEREKLTDLREQLQTEKQVIAAIQNINDPKIYKILAQTVVLEHKYGANGVSVMEYVLHYLNEISDKETEVYVHQRVSIYSLLSTEGSVQAQNVLMEQLQSSGMSDIERTSLLLAIATLSDPSSELIQTLEQMISQSDDTTTSLLLAYGALVVNVDPDKEFEMVSFLVDRIPDGTDNNHVLIHVLHALGNTQSLLAVKYITMYTQHEDEAVRLTAVTALRLFTGLPSVQQHLLYALDNFTQSVSLVSTIIDSLRDGYNHNEEISIDQNLLQLLAWNSLQLGCSDLQTELIEFLHVLDTPESLSLADMIGDGRQMTTRGKRGSTTDWDSTADSSYNLIAPLHERQQDVRDFPGHRAFLWAERVGRTSGSYQVYIEAIGGAFAGYNERCEFKVNAKAVVRGHAFGHEAEIVQVLGRLVLQNGDINRKAYAKFGSSVVIDIDETISLSIETTYNLPTYKKTLLSFSFSFTIWIVPVTLDVNVEVGITGSTKLRGSYDGQLKGIASVVPTAFASVDASVYVSVLVARAGLTLTGTVPYNIYVDLSVWIDVCATTRGGMSLRVYDEWPGITITLSVFLQIREISWWGISWGDRHYWDIFSTTISSSGGRRLRYYYET